MAKKVATTSTADTIEQGVVAFAEQLGTLVGTVQAKADGWLDREALGKELTRIRDGAAQLLDRVSPGAPTRRRTPAKGKQAKPAASRSRGPVDAPGKRHRQPPPQVKADKHASDPKARIIGNPGLKTGRRGGRGGR